MELWVTAGGGVSRNKAVLIAQCLGMLFVPTLYFSPSRIFWGAAWHAASAVCSLTPLKLHWFPWSQGSCKVILSSAHGQQSADLNQPWRPDVKSPGSKSSTSWHSLHAVQLAQDRTGMVVKNGKWTGSYIFLLWALKAHKHFFLCSFHVSAFYVTFTHIHT